MLQIQYSYECNVKKNSFILNPVWSICSFHLKCFNLLKIWSFSFNFVIVSLVSLLAMSVNATYNSMHVILAIKNHFIRHINVRRYKWRRRNSYFLSIEVCFDFFNCLRQSDVSKDFWHCRSSLSAQGKISITLLFSLCFDCGTWIYCMSKTTKCSNLPKSANQNVFSPVQYFLIIWSVSMGGYIRPLTVKKGSFLTVDG